MLSGREAEHRWSQLLYNTASASGAQRHTPVSFLRLRFSISLLRLRLAADRVSTPCLVLVSCVNPQTSDSLF